MGAEFNKHFQRASIKPCNPLVKVRSEKTINHFYSLLLLLLLLSSYFCIYTRLMEQLPFIWNISQMGIIGSKRKWWRQNGDKTRRRRQKGKSFNMISQGTNGSSWCYIIDIYFSFRNLTIWFLWFFSPLLLLSQSILSTTIPLLNQSSSSSPARVGIKYYRLSDSQS